MDDAKKEVPHEAGLKSLDKWVVQWFQDFFETLWRLVEFFPGVERLFLKFQTSPGQLLPTTLAFQFNLMAEEFDRST